MGAATPEIWGRIWGLSFLAVSGVFRLSKSKKNRQEGGFLKVLQ